nr:hypothetical protein BaRGS_015083 [Batillaria attramentaria]
MAGKVERADEGFSKKQDGRLLYLGDMASNWDKIGTARGLTSDTEIAVFLVKYAGSRTPIKVTSSDIYDFIQLSMNMAGHLERTNVKFDEQGRRLVYLGEMARNWDKIGTACGLASDNEIAVFLVK